jgi:hypothetical protein
MHDEEIIDLMQTQEFLEHLDRYKRAYVDVPSYPQIKKAMARRAIRGDVGAAQELHKNISDKDKVTIEETRRISGTMEQLGKLLSGGF